MFDTIAIAASELALYLIAKITVQYWWGPFRYTLFSLDWWGYAILFALGSGWLVNVILSFIRIYHVNPRVTQHPTNTHALTSA
jgi:hypothetical protein